MDGQIAIEEVEYWMELEGLLARFHQDLYRIRETLAALEEPELVRYMDGAMLSVGAACCAAAHKLGSVKAPLSVRA
jgi:hypothetical protein